MTKIEFILSLRDKLNSLPEGEVCERLNFYSEMIEDRMEEGLSEEEAVLAVGDCGEIAAQILAEAPQKVIENKEKPKGKLRVWEIVLLAVGSPIWLSLAIAAVAVVFSLYVSLWAVIVSLWATFGALVASAFGGIIMSVAFVEFGHTFSGLAVVSAVLVLAGLSILFLLACKAATKGSLVLTGKVFGIFVKKGEA